MFEIYCFFYYRGLNAAESVINTMRVAQLHETNETKFSVIKGTLKHSNLKDFKSAVKKYKFQLNEYQLLEIITELALINIDWLFEVNFTFLY